MDIEAGNRFLWTWTEYAKALRLDSNLTLRKFCERVHTDSQRMQKWVSSRGYSVLELKKELLAVELTQDPSPTTSLSRECLSQKSNTPSFSRVVPTQEAEESLSLLGISVTFNSGTI